MEWQREAHEYEMRQEARTRENNRIMQEFGLSGLSLDLFYCLEKTISKGQSPSSKGKTSGRDACPGEGSDLSDYILEVEEHDDGDDDTDLE
jgi:hypothetical protein